MILDITAIADKVRKLGPTRMITFNEEGVSHNRYKGKSATIIFVRDDGWTLGASEENELLAEKQWVDKWVGYFRIPSWEFFPYLREL